MGTENHQPGELTALRHPQVSAGGERETRGARATAERGRGAQEEREAGGRGRPQVPVQVYHLRGDLRISLVQVYHLRGDLKISLQIWYRCTIYVVTWGYPFRYGTGVPSMLWLEDIPSDMAQVYHLRCDLRISLQIWHRCTIYVVTWGYPFRYGTGVPPTLWLEDIPSDMAQVYHLRCDLRISLQIWHRCTTYDTYRQLVTRFGVNPYTISVLYYYRGKVVCPYTILSLYNI